MALEFEALGPLQAHDDSGPLDLGPPKQRALLALLLVHANEVVSADRILDELWGDQGATKENALWVTVSRLRSTLERGKNLRGESTLLHRRGSGYLLEVDPERFDVTRFDDLVLRGRRALPHDPAVARDLLSDALALWRGPAFDDVRYEQFVHAETTRLEESRISALEDRIEADLRCGRDAELVSELEALRATHPLRERLVTQLVLSLYRSGRPAEALRAVARFRRELGEETGLDPSPTLCRLEERVLLHDPTLLGAVRERPGHDGDDGVAENPYKGLRPFTEDDVAEFFGRDRLTSELLRAIRGHASLITLVGASGSGKSSVVRAGLIPALRKDAVPGSADWLIATMVPGARPLAELEAALLRCSADAPNSLGEQLRDRETGVLRAVLRVLPETRERLVLVIDQFEELFTLADESTRIAFLDMLVVALDDPHRRLMVVATLRADFYGHSLSHPALGARLPHGLVNAASLTAEELDAAATHPARLAGVSIEPALLTQIIADVGRDAGALPLFEFALTALFDQRDGDVLTSGTYRAIGGVSGAVAGRATDLFEALSEEERVAAKQLFLRLVTVSDDEGRVRRRVGANEILSTNTDPVAMQAVIASFGAHRLLVFDADPLTGMPTVEVAHEALLTAWPQLAAWIDASRADIRRHRVFLVAVGEWELSQRDPEYLLTGTRLAEYATWATESSLLLTAREQHYIEQSCAFRDENERQAAIRRAKEAQVSRRSRRRFWELTAALALLVAIGAVLLVAWVGRGHPAKVGLLEPDDGAFGANITAGVVQAQRELGFTLEQVPLMIQAGSQFRELASAHPGLIIVDGGVVAHAGDVLTAFPHTKFGVIDSLASAPNLETIRYADEEGAYLVGMAAALKSRTGIVGYVGALPGYDHQFDNFRAGFEAGALAVAPHIHILETYIEAPLFGQFTMLLQPFQRRDLAKARAVALYRRGADVIFHSAGESGFGVFAAAVEESHHQPHPLWAIGVDNDQWAQISDPETRDHVLTSMIKRADLGARLIVEDFVRGRFHAGSRTLHLADGALDYSTQNPALTLSIRARLETARADIIAGRIVVPTRATGTVLELDPVSAAFTSATQHIDPDSLEHLAETLMAAHPEEWDSACSTGTRSSCAQYILEHLAALRS